MALGALKVRFLVGDAFDKGGGVLTVVRNLTADLAAHGHDVEIVSVLQTRDTPLRPPSDQVPLRALVDMRRQVDDDRIPLTGTPSRLIPVQDRTYRFFTAASDAALSSYLSHLTNEIVVSVNPGLNVALSRVSNGGTVKIGMEHRALRTRPNDYLQFAADNSHNLDHMLVLTRPDARRYRQLYRRRVPVSVMPNGIEPYPGPLASQKASTVIAVGALTRNKGFDRLIDAWAMVHRRHPTWRLHIYGEGRRETELLAQIRHLGLEGVVFLKGYSTDVRARMAEASFLAASSRAEGFPMVILEGMTCGLPVVSFDSPHGPRQMITDGVNGYLIRNGDIDGMSQALNSLISSSTKERLEMGAAAVRTALQFEQSKITQRWIRLMQRLARQKQQTSQKDQP